MSLQLTSQETIDLAHKFLIPYSSLLWNKYMVAKHHVLIAKHLEAVEAGHINRLMIFMPPRAGKTMLSSQNFIPWYLGRNPEHQVIYATYQFERAGDVGKKARDNMNSQHHRNVFPECCLSTDSKGKNKFETTRGGMAVFTGTDGAITGRGAHLLVIDDPIKGRKKAESEKAQKELRDWYSSDAYTRLMDQNAIIVILTRWHYNDLAGWLLREHPQEQWRVLNLPAIAMDEDDILDRSPGEPLWPEKYPIDRLMQTKHAMSSRDWASLYQQRPVPEEGGMVNLNWFKRFNIKSDEWISFLVAIRMGNKSIKPPNGIKYIVQSWDTAFKESELNDPSACTIWGVAKNGFYLLGVINQRMNFPKLRASVVNTWSEWCLPNMRPVTVLIEDKASGQSLIQDIKQNYNQIPVIPIKADASKQVRLSEVSALIEAGRVYLPHDAEWTAEYETQIMEFPLGKNDDLVDSTSQFLRWAGRPKFKKSKVPLYWK